MSILQVIVISMVFKYNRSPMRQSLYLLESPTTMRMNRADRRAHLIKAAMVVARREGFAQVTTRAVAQEADISLGVVHYCFNDKEELLYEMAARTVDEVIHTITKSVLATAYTSNKTGLAGLEESLFQDSLTILNEVSAQAENSPLVYEVISYAFHTSDFRFQQLITMYYDALAHLAYSYLDSVARRFNVTWSMDLSQLVPVILDLIHGYLLRHLSLRTPQNPALASSADGMKIVLDSLEMVVRTVVRNAEEITVA